LITCHSTAAIAIEAPKAREAMANARIEQRFTGRGMLRYGIKNRVHLKK
jgi:hypothetical protein